MTILNIGRDNNLRLIRDPVDHRVRLPCPRGPGCHRIRHRGSGAPVPTAARVRFFLSLLGLNLKVERAHPNSALRSSWCRCCDRFWDSRHPRWFGRRYFRPQSIGLAIFLGRLVRWFQHCFLWARRFSKDCKSLRQSSWRRCHHRQNLRWLERRSVSCFH